MMHRTTIYLEETVFHRVQAVATRTGRSMARTIEDLLRTALQPKRRRQENIKIPLHRNNGPLPGIDIADRDRLYDVLSNS